MNLQAKENELARRRAWYLKTRPKVRVQQRTYYERRREKVQALRLAKLKKNRDSKQPFLDEAFQSRRYRSKYSSRAPFAEQLNQWWEEVGKNKYGRKQDLAKDTGIPFPTQSYHFSGRSFPWPKHCDAYFRVTKQECFSPSWRIVHRVIHHKVRRFSADVGRQLFFGAAREAISLGYAPATLQGHLLTGLERTLRQLEKDGLTSGGHVDVTVLHRIIDKLPTGAQKIRLFLPEFLKRRGLLTGTEKVPLDSKQKKFPAHLRSEVERYCFALQAREPQRGKILSKVAVLRSIARRITKRFPAIMSWSTFLTSEDEFQRFYLSLSCFESYVLRDFVAFCKEHDPSLRKMPALRRPRKQPKTKRVFSVPPQPPRGETPRQRLLVELLYRVGTPSKRIARLRVSDVGSKVPIGADQHAVRPEVWSEYLDDLRDELRRMPTGTDFIFPNHSATYLRQVVKQVHPELSPGALFERHLFEDFLDDPGAFRLHARRVHRLTYQQIRRLGSQFVSAIATHPIVDWIGSCLSLRNRRSKFKVLRGGRMVEASWKLASSHRLTARMPKRVWDQLRPLTKNVLLAVVSYRYHQSVRWWGQQRLFRSLWIVKAMYGSKWSSPHKGKVELWTNHFAEIHLSLKNNSADIWQGRLLAFDSIGKKRRLWSMPFIDRLLGYFPCNCVVSRHHQVSEVDQLILRGIPLVEISRNHQIDAHLLQKHSVRCLHFKRRSDGSTTGTPLPGLREYFNSPRITVSVK